MDSKMKIKVLKDGPYRVMGNIPLYRKSIIHKDKLYVLKTTEVVETDDTYHLCRCGFSAHKPFCDGAHIAAGFDGTETADKTDYADRAGMLIGEDVDLLDDDRCAFARFCHRERGDVWELTEQSSDPENKREAIEGASECPSGRLVSVLKNGELVEKDLEASISIIQDPQQKVSAGLFVNGYIPIEDADGKLYEVRNRIALCRCGASKNKPFCDAAHVSIGFNDGFPLK